LEKRIHSTPYVYVVYDMYPDMPAALGVVPRDSAVVCVWERLMRILYRDADRIVVLGESMEQRLTDKMRNDAEFDSNKLVEIPNWEDPEFIQPISKEENDFAREQGTVSQFTLLYSGNIGEFHELKTAIDAIAVLEERGRDDIRFLVIGEGSRKAALEEYVDSRQISNVEFLPFQPLEKVPQTLTSGDASLVGIKPEMVGMCVSSKLYSSLAAGMPILATVGEGDEVQRVVKECDCGAYVEPSDARAAADVLESWADDSEEVRRMGENARKCLESRYTSSHAISKYQNLLAELTT
jgi:glycosyltransferase involved in cell wall biosynthesis